MSREYQQEATGPSGANALYVTVRCDCCDGMTDVAAHNRARTYRRGKEQRIRCDNCRMYCMPRKRCVDA